MRIAKRRAIPERTRTVYVVTIYRRALLAALHLSRTGIFASLRGAKRAIARDLGDSDDRWEKGPESLGEWVLRDAEGYRMAAIKRVRMGVLVAGLVP